MIRQRLSKLGGDLRENSSFFVLFGAFLLIGALLLLRMDQGDAIFFLSKYRSPGANLFFQYSTTLGEWYFFVLSLIGLLFVKYRYALVLPFLGLSVSAVTQSLKRFFAHPRPFAYFRDLNFPVQITPIEGVDVYMGANSFPSGHTMTAFALFAFLALCLSKKTWNGVLFFALALIVAISRIYLVHHFLEDVYLGAILGVLLALAFYYLANNLSSGRRPWLDGSLVI